MSFNELAVRLMRLRLPLLSKLNDIGHEDFPDFEAALLQCEAGYESADVAAVVVSKTRLLLRSNSYRNLIPTGVLLGALSLIGKSDTVRVVDLGGAAGAHYLMMRSILPSSVALSWTIVETHQMVAAAKSLNLSSEVTFTTDLASALAADGVVPDLVFASGVLMCLPRPIETLKQICESRPLAIVVARTGLAPDDKTRIVIQSSMLSENGIGLLPEGFIDRKVLYPNTFVPKSVFEEVLGAGYEIKVFSQETMESWRVGSTPIGQYAYLGVLRDSGPI